MPHQLPLTNIELIPAIDVMDDKVVRLTRGDPASATIYSHDPPAVARRWEEAGADALHVVDLDAALGLRQGPQLDRIRQIVEAVNIPVQVGGGIRSLKQASDVLSSGAQRVVLGTMALQDPAALQATLRTLGAERILVALDYANGTVRIKGWQETTTLEPLEALQQLCHQGVRHFLLTAIAQDGTLAGADLDVLTAATRLRQASIYASGGIATADDVRQLSRLGVRGIIIGKALYEGRLTIDQLRQAMAA